MQTLSNPGILCSSMSSTVIKDTIFTIIIRKAKLLATIVVKYKQVNFIVTVSKHCQVSGNAVDIDQIPHSAASELSLHKRLRTCCPKTNLTVLRLRSERRFYLRVLF